MTQNFSAKNGEDTDKRSILNRRSLPRKLCVLVVVVFERQRDIFYLQV